MSEQNEPPPTPNPRVHHSALRDPRAEQNVQVTQADREAAADCIKRGVSHPHPEDVLSGTKDDWFFVQAFARHRLDTEKRVRESLPNGEWIRLHVWADAEAACDVVINQTTFGSEVMPGEREWYRRGAEAAKASIRMACSYDAQQSPRESLAGEANVERMAQRIERAPVRIYRTPDEARAYMLGRADAVALVRAKLVGDVDDHIAALAALERTTDAEGGMISQRGPSSKGTTDAG